jgi:ribose transport system ATP-binding protein
MQSSEPVISLKNLSKEFGGGRPALDAVDIDILPGEIHGLLGQNGSGKSTLIKILAGYHAPEPGAELRVNGEVVALPIAPGQFRELGMSFVHQNLGLADEMSVLDNVRVGRYERGLGWRIPWRSERRRVRDALSRFGLNVDIDTPISELSQGTRAVIAIARAVQEIEGSERGLLILDEPTPYLPRDAVTRLFEAMRKVASENIAILFVSHRLEEVHEITDRVTVLRDGKVVGTAETAGLDAADLIEMIVGRRLEDLYPDPPTAGQKRVLSVRDLSGEVVQNLDFDLNAGEVLGLTGLLGNGFEEVPYLLMGTLPTTSGEITFEDRSRQANRMSVRDRIDLGMVLVPANRERDGVAMGLTLGENVSLPRISNYYHRFLLDGRSERREVIELLRRFDVRPPDPNRTMGTLSGGNQQKAVLGKWLATNPRVLVLHEPTQGVDIGARQQIFAQIRDATDSGCSVILASLEYEDLAHLCDRVLVFHGGRVTSELPRRELSEERIVEQCLRPIGDPVVQQ